MEERVRVTDIAETCLGLVEILTVTSVITVMKSEVFTDRARELRSEPKI